MRSLLRPFLPSLRPPGRQEALKDRLALLRSVGREALLTVDAEGIVLAANEAASLVLRGDPVGGEVGAYVPGLGAGGLMALAAGWGEPVEQAARRRSGETFTAEVSLGGHVGAAGWRGLVRLRDVTERVWRFAEMERLALHDALTGLPNRLLFQDRLTQGLLQADRRQQVLAVLMLDLNRFKLVNDTLGHHVGDRLLQEVAPRLAAPLRRSDSLARLGGDEFAIILGPPADLEEAGRVAERLVEAVAEPFMVDGMRLEVGVSIGMALYPDHAGGLEDLLQHADAAMYAAKEGGLGIAVYDDPGSGTVSRRRGLLHDLRLAIETDRLTLLFQPKVMAGSRELVAAEVLVAWEHPEHGLLRAPDFLPLAEQTGLIMPLTVAVLNACLREQQRWQRRGLALPLAVNLASRWLVDLRFPEVLAQVLANWGARPKLLTLEATEDAIMADPKRATEVLRAVSRLGCRIALDDFGTGYSCLSHLQRLPVSELKIDKSFVLGMAEDAAAAALVHSVVLLAHGLGLSVAAEGVETETVAGRLAELGCDELQGFLFGAPMPVPAFDDWLAARRPVPAALAGPEGR